jgi:hypothetical protein
VSAALSEGGRLSFTNLPTYLLFDPMNVRVVIAALSLGISAVLSSAEPLPQFSLADINDTKLPGTQIDASPRRGQRVSPSHYRQRVVVVYFGQEI